MTLEELMDQWPGLSPDERFAAFLAWIVSELDFVADLLGSISVERDAAVSSLSGSPQSGFRVNPDVFINDDPAFAIAIGDTITVSYLQHAQKEWYDKQKEIEKLEKERRKYLDKLWEKLLKDAKPKGDPGYAAWYYSYYLPKYYGEYGSP